MRRSWEDAAAGFMAAQVVSPGEDVALFLQIRILPCFFISFFFCIGNYIAFYKYKDFFYIVSVLYVLYLWYSLHDVFFLSLVYILIHEIENLL